MSKIFKSLAPVALSFLAPGLGTAIGGALGAGAAFAPVVGNAALGAGLGAIGGGGLKGALTGGLTGGVSSAISSGLGGIEIPGLGTGAGASLDKVTGTAGLQGPTQGSGLLGKLTSATATGGQPMKLGSLLSAGGDILGYTQGKSDIEDIQKMLAQQSAQAQGQLQPYAQAGQQALANMQAPSMEALQNDPGYQFRLQQGQQALERSLAAQGMGQSGAALKAAQEYGQGLADQTYNDYFARQGQVAGLGYGAAGGLGSLYTNLGNVQAAAELERMNSRNKLYSNLTGNEGLISGLGGLFGYA